jgi:hypothetical protein
VGVGIETIMLMGELPHGLEHGIAFQENFIKVLSIFLRSNWWITAFVLTFYGVRNEKRSMGIKKLK